MPKSLTAAEIDAYVGSRVRERRERLRISQGRLGKHLGLTFSQVQKYEKGSNRIGAGRLYQIASFLGVSPEHFFEGLPETERDVAPSKELSHDARMIAGMFDRILSNGIRAAILQLFVSLDRSGKVRKPRR